MQRQERKRSTRLAIRRVAVGMFKQHGFADTTVEDIAAAAGISPRTFFNYFATKDEVVMLPYDDLSLLLRDELARRPHGEPLFDSARAAVHVMLEFLGADDELRALLLDAARLLRNVPALRAADAAQQVVWEDEFAAAFGERGRHADPVSVRVQAGAAVAATRAGIRTWAESPHSVSLPGAIDAAFDALHAGALPPGLRRSAS